MKSLLFTILSLLTISTYAQRFSITGTVTSKDDGKAIANVFVCMNHAEHCVTTDEKGNFKIENIKPGKYNLTISSVEFDNIQQEIIIADKDVKMNISMSRHTAMLDSVEIKTTRQTLGITRLKDVDGAGIYAGKKSEVIVMNDITVNKATNNSRQIYSKVAGLNIYENDGGAGIQLAIGGRGLDPNRVSNFNTRQNGYDISADALGYPESYYTPPAEAIDRIEIVRGAASLQYGTQFGGIINFKLNSGVDDKKMQVTERISGGSWGFFNTATSIGGTINKFKYYAFYQHKSGSGWRPNSQFNLNMGYAAATYKPNEKLSITAEYTHMDYLEHQPGGLSDAMFAADPRLSTKGRNWFKVNWNLAAILLDYKITNNLKFNTRLFGLLANRSALGIINTVTETSAEDDDPRQYRTDTYTNWGNESRLIYTYNTKNENPFVLLAGVRYYSGHTNREIGIGNSGSTGLKSDFAFDKSNAYDSLSYSKYTFPEHNLALFAENIFRINDKLSVIPGLRYESIDTKANGFYNDLTGGLNAPSTGVVQYYDHVVESRVSSRSFLIGGIGLSYDKNNSMQFYANISQNYRSINFNNMSIVNPNIYVDPNLKDEKGYSADVGMRGHISDVFNYDVSLFTIYYADRIGIIQIDTVVHTSSDTLHVAGSYTTNISASRNLGLESFVELDVWKLIKGENAKMKLSVFSNLSFIDARYIGSEESAFRNKKVELVPPVIFRSGITFKKNKLSISYQYSYTAQQFGDATNAPNPAYGGIIGPIPAYFIMDLSADYKLSKMFLVSATFNNITNNHYYTRRADSYPGPGIIPADGRSVYCTLQVKL